MKARFLLVACLLVLLVATLSVQTAQTAVGGAPPTPTRVLSRSIQSGTYKVFLPVISKPALPIPAKGVALHRSAAVCADLTEQGIVWYYDFSADPIDCGLAWVATEAVPMAWGASSVGSPMKGNSNWVLGFNEPNNPSQANLTPHNAALAWRTFEANNPTRRLASPGPYDGYSSPPFLSGVDWLSQFRAEYISLYGAPPRLDALAAHCYWQIFDRGGSDCKSVLNGYINLANSWGVSEIWVTEYNFMAGLPCNFTGYDWVASSDAMINFIRANPKITRYAWFTDRAGSHTECYWAPLFDNSGVITQYGTKYQSY